MIYSLKATQKSLTGHFELNSASLQTDKRFAPYLWNNLFHTLEINVSY